MTKAFQPWIEGIAQTIAKEVEAEDGEENGAPRAERQPAIFLEPHHNGIEIPAPTWGGQVCTAAEEVQRGFYNDRCGHARGGGDNDGGHAVGEDQAVVAAAKFKLTAKVREWRVKPLGAEAPVPQAIADAFRRSNRAVWHDDDLWKVQARGQMWESL